MISVKRIYESPSRNDGTRVLVDRLWPRGVSKEDAKIDAWLKDIAPSDELRHWFDHDPSKWSAFKRKYATELKHNKALLEELGAMVSKGHVTLVFAAKDEEHNNAVALRDYLKHEHTAGRHRTNVNGAKA